MNNKERSLADRVTELEMQLMHLEKTVQTLDGVIMEAGQRIDKQDREIAALRLRLNQMQQPERDEDDGPDLLGDAWA